MLWAQLDNVAWSQTAEVAVARDAIPWEEYTSWSIFLVCNPEWVKPQSTQKLEQLHKQFLAFGEAIGPYHAAVWLAKSDADDGSSPKSIDIARATRFCQNLKLPPSEGPYLLFSTRYPGQAITGRPATFASDFGNHFILSLNRISADDTTRLLKAVADQLVGGDLNGLDTQSKEYLEVWKRAFQGLLVGGLSEVSLTLDTGLSSTAIAQPSATLLETLKSTKAASPVGFGSKLIATKADKTPARLTAFVAERTDLLLDGPKAVYAGTFAVALQNLDAQGDRSALDDPVVINVTAPGASEYIPKPVTVSRLQEWMNVELLVPDPQAAKILVSASSGPEDPGASVELEVMRPRFVLSTVSTRILGWGLGTTQIAVMAHGMKSPNGYVLSLTSEGGGLDAGKVTLDASGSGVTTLRSDASPGATVRVADPDLSANVLTVAFRAPFLFFVAAILGGLLGAYLRGKGRKKWLQALAIGIASAILMTVGQAVGFTAWIATALGANSVATSGEAVVFFLGAIAALIGVSAFIPGLAKK